MIPTPTDEIRAIRRELAARLNNDIDLIVEETRRQEQESGLTYITLPARPARPEVTPDQPPQSSSTG